MPIQSYFSREEGILGRFEAGCFPAYTELVPGLIGPSFNIDPYSFVSQGRGEATCSYFGLVYALVEPKN